MPKEYKITYADNITSDLHDSARIISSRIHNGKRILGKPARGLYKTLQKIEADGPSFISKLPIQTVDTDYKQTISKMKAGIKGEEQLGDVLAFEANKFDTLVCFASTSIGSDKGSNQTNLDNKGYIPDTDFVLVCGDSILVLDAKNCYSKTPIQVIKEGDFDTGRDTFSIKDASSKTLVPNILSSTHLWINYLNTFDGLIFDDDIYEDVVLVNNQPKMSIFKNQDYYDAPFRVVHVQEIDKILTDFIKDAKNNNTFNLYLLAIIYQNLIKEDSDIDAESIVGNFLGA